MYKLSILLLLCSSLFACQEQKKWEQYQFPQFQEPCACLDSLEAALLQRDAGLRDMQRLEARHKQPEAIASIDSAMQSQQRFLQEEQEYLLLRNRALWLICQELLKEHKNSCPPSVLLETRQKEYLPQEQD